MKQKMKQKRCPRCDKVKLITKFYIKKHRIDSWCKTCSLKQAKIRMNKVRNFIRTCKSKPCMDCKKKYPYYVMDFDHRDPKKKKFALSKVVGKSCTLKKTLQIEINKCDVVCANCHRIRTQKQRR